MPENTALIDEIMAALDAENSTNVELIVRNTQNGATKKMALASLEQIIYSYLTTAPVVTNLASVLGVPPAFYNDYQSLQSLATGLGNVSVEFLKQTSSKDLWNEGDTETFSDIPAVTMIYWYNTVTTNGCGLILKDGTSLHEISKTTNFFGFSCSSVGTVTVTASSAAGGNIKMFCIRPS